MLLFCDDYCWVMTEIFYTQWVLKTHICNVSILTSNNKYRNYCACDELSFTESMCLFFYRKKNRLAMYIVHCILYTWIRLWHLKRKISTYKCHPLPAVIFNNAAFHVIPNSIKGTVAREFFSTISSNQEWRERISRVFIFVKNLVKYHSSYSWSTQWEFLCEVTLRGHINSVPCMYGVTQTPYYECMQFFDSVKSR